MEAHQLALLRVEPSRLVQHARGHAQLAHVVHERGQLHLHELGSSEAKPDRHLTRRCGDLERVPVGVAVGLRKRLDERANLRLGVAEAELTGGMVAQQAADQRGHLVEQVTLASLEPAFAVGPAQAERPALLGSHQDGRRGNAPEAGRAGRRGHASPDQVRVGAGSRHRRRWLATSRGTHKDPCLLESEHGARVLGQAVEHHPRVAELLRGGHAHLTGGGVLAAGRTGKPVAPRGGGEHREKKEIGEQAETDPPCQHIHESHACEAFPSWTPPRGRAGVSLVNGPQSSAIGPLHEFGGASGPNYSPARGSQPMSSTRPSRKW